MGLDTTTSMLVQSYIVQCAGRPKDEGLRRYLSGRWWTEVTTRNVTVTKSTTLLTRYYIWMFYLGEHPVYVRTSYMGLGIARVEHTAHCLTKGKCAPEENVYVKLHQFFSILETYVKLVKTSLPKIGSSKWYVWGICSVPGVSKRKYAVCEKGRVRGGA